MTPTSEQKEIVASPSRKLAVAARAGTGKTSTLVMYCAARKSENILYLAFSKAVQLAAQSRMPQNVKSKTTHAIAYPAAMDLFGTDVNQKIGNTYPTQIARHFRCSMLTALAAQATLANWFSSTTTEIQKADIPLALQRRLKEPGRVVDLARRLWGSMQDRQAPEIKMPHEGYIKRFLLSGRQIGRYDRIVVDEAQDITPCTIGIITRHPSATTMVGDAYQAIFQFRKCVNAMAAMGPDTTLHLTRSFRFGEGIAELANTLLQGMRGEQPRIVGCGQARNTLFTVDRRKPFAIIARTNAGVLEMAERHLSDRRPFIFVGGAASYRFEKILDAWRLWRGLREDIKDAYLKTFETFEQLKQAATEAEDQELLSLVRIVERYSYGLPVVIDGVVGKAVDVDASRWDHIDAIWLSTAHKAKGAEFRNVVMADDYKSFLDDEGDPVAPELVPDEDVNLAYVAVTRAKESLQVSQQLYEWLTHPSVNKGSMIR